MKFCMINILKMSCLTFMLTIICGENLKPMKSYENRMKRQLFGGQRCATYEGRPGTCQIGSCPNLEDKMVVICNSNFLPMRCCPDSNKEAVLPKNPSVACGVRPHAQNLIVGGTVAPPYSWPWAVAIHQIKYNYDSSTNSRFICGGTIINSQYVMTAAHCIIRKTETLEPKHFKIQMGAHDLRDSGFIANVSQIKVHEDYIPSYHRNDIALLKLSEPINFGVQLNVAPVCLPRPDMERNIMPGRMSTLVGWGTTTEGGKASSMLHEVKVPIISNDECAQKYRILLKSGDQIYEKQLCASYPEGGKDTCQGDSGGSLTVPLNHIYYQMGIVSFGKGCAQPGFPGVYTRVNSFLHWIGAHMED